MFLVVDPIDKKRRGAHAPRLPTHISGRVIHHLVELGAWGARRLRMVMLPPDRVEHYHATRARRKSPVRRIGKSKRQACSYCVNVYLSSVMTVTGADQEHPMSKH